MFDTNQTGTIDMNEFGRLFAYIQQWKAMFENFDRDRLVDHDDHDDDHDGHEQFRTSNQKTKSLPGSSTPPFWQCRDFESKC